MFVAIFGCSAGLEKCIFYLIFLLKSVCFVCYFPLKSVNDMLYSSNCRKIEVDCYR